MSAEAKTDARGSGFGSFPRVFWVVVLMEFFERGSYYGLMSVLSVYMVEDISRGGLGFDKQDVGIINGVVRPLLYVLPILAGAIADRFGYRRTLAVAFTLLSAGYALSGQMTNYWLLFASLLVMATGAGIFKPIISGTIARTTNESNSGLGFGIFYWSINLGAFLFPALLVNYLRTNGYPWSAIFTASAIGTGIMLIPTIFLYKDPPKPKDTKSLGEVLAGAIMVLLDWRFVLMIVIYSGFWILYFQMFDTVLWYLGAHVDMTPVDAGINSVLGSVGIGWKFKFAAEHVTVMNAGTIIVLQLLISTIVKKWRALPTMIGGIAIGTTGFILLALSSSPWVFVLGIMVFSIGEMTAHPKFISYVGLIAPEDKKATYMGYSFLYGVIGSSVGAITGANLYKYFVDGLGLPRVLWIIFACIGGCTIVGLLLYDRFIAVKPVRG
ncbi:MAG: MFS transporter [Polyangiaceae bacterium]|nr:MFS transporter [Polyangiaceae bacterium]